MKKLLLLFTLLIVAGILFNSCKKDEDVITPPETVWENPEAGGPFYTVDLVRGESDDVGDVIIAKLADGGLQVTYKIDEYRPCRITNVYIDISKESGTNPFSIDFHINSQNGPAFNNFDSKTLEGVSVNGIDSKEVVMTFSAASLSFALGGSIPSKIYLAVFGDVSCANAGALENYCPELIDTTSILGRSSLSDEYQINNYLMIEFNQAVVDSQVKFYGWCLDAGRGLVNFRGKILNFLCSNNLIDTCIVNYPENLKKANWIINNRKDYSAYAVQAALWTLLTKSDSWRTNNEFTKFVNSNYQSLLDAANSVDYNTWRPMCGEKILIIVYQPSDNLCDPSLLQVFGIEVPVCDENSLPAMAYPFPLDKFSSPFPGANQFRYISFNY